MKIPLTQSRQLVNVKYFILHDCQHYFLTTLRREKGHDLAKLSELYALMPREIAIAIAKRVARNSEYRGRSLRTARLSRTLGGGGEHSTSLSCP